MNLEELYHGREYILLETISGSRAYGLHSEASDTDIRGIYYMPYRAFFGLKDSEQIANDTNDTVFYEIGRYVELLLKNNPNILELLNAPEDCIKHRHPLIGLINPADYLSRLCAQTFAGYAMSQVKKAGGLNKKIFNPVGKEKKSVLDFCYVIQGAQSVPLNSWLMQKGLDVGNCGLSRIDHAKDMYALFYSETAKLNGIAKNAANDVSLSSIPEGMSPIALMSFNKDGYSIYCREYKEYWDWVGKRNEQRYSNTIASGKNYDSKNMMHTFRLLNMAEEIAREKVVHVRRKDREFLLKVKAGAFEYNDLMQMADEKLARIEDLFAKSDLPDMPNEVKGMNTLIEIRTALYKK